MTISRLHRILVFAPLLALLSAGCGTSNEARDQRAPLFHVYLTWQGDTSTTITVNYHTNEPGPSRVYFDRFSRGGVPEAYAHQTEGTSHRVPFLDFLDARSVHVVELEGLVPDQAYYFVAGDAETGFSAEKKFRTLPAGNAPLRFITGGDMGTNPIVRELLRHAAAEDPMFGLIGGDIAYANGALDEYGDWDVWLDNWEEMMVTPDGCTVPIVAAIGNHETNSFFPPGIKGKAPFYFDYLAQGNPDSYFVKTFGANTVIFALDTSHFSAHFGTQLTWLEEEMARYEDMPYKIAVYHVPLYPAHRDFNGLLSAFGRTYWAPVFDDYGLDVAFENHDHVLKRSKRLKGNMPDPEGTLYLGDGCFGRTPRTGDQAGASYLDLVKSVRHFWFVEIPPLGSGQQQMNFTAIDEAGAVVDRYALPVRKY